MRINLKLLLVFLEITLIPISILGYVSYSGAKKEITAQVIQKLESLANSQKVRLETANKKNLEQLMLLTGNINLRQETDTYIKTPNKASMEKIQMILDEQIKGLPDYWGASIADLNGKVIASTSPLLAGQSISQYKYFQEGKKLNSVTNFIKDQNGVFSLVFSGPLIVNNKPVGVFIASTNGSDILSIVSDYNGLGKTGETIIVTKDLNGNTLFLTPVRFDPKAALTRVISKNKMNVPSNHAANGEETVMIDAVDYNNTPVVAVTKFIPGPNWGIVAKINQNEAYGPIESLRNLLIFMGIVTSVIIIVISISVAQSFTNPIKRLTDAAKKISLGDLSQRININTKGELGILADVFNIMASKLQASYQGMERKVINRTQQLTTKVGELENTKKAMLNLMDDLEESSNVLGLEKAKAEAMLVSIGEGLIAVDNGGRVLVMNKAAEQMLGWESKELDNRVITSLPLEDEDGKPVPIDKRPTTIALATGKIAKVSFYFVRKDKTRIPIAITATPIKLEGKTIGLVEIIRDITQELAVDRAKSEFVSLASHQLRTPLGISKWYLEALNEEGYIKKSPTLVKNYLDEINKSNERVLSLVRNLLSVSRIDEKRVKDLPKSVNLTKVAEEIVAQLRVVADKKKVALKMITENKKIPLINIDPLRLHEVIENLIVNAIEYSSAGDTIDVIVNKVDSRLELSVKDTGIGMSAVDQKKIFTKFYRTEQAIRHNPEGSGLGLYVVKSYVEGWGGTISVESTEGVGSKFTLNLPIKSKKTI